MTAEWQHLADRALQEAIRAIDAGPGAARCAHEELTLSYSQRVIAALGNGIAGCGVLPGITPRRAA